MEPNVIAKLIVFLAFSGLLFIGLTAILGLGANYATVMAGMIGTIVATLVAHRKNS